MEKNNKNTRRNSVRQGDIVLVNYGRSAGSKADEIRPSLVISNDMILGSERMIAVIPLFRQPSRACRLDDISLNQDDCKGLKYTMYVQVLYSRMVNAYQMLEVFGHVEDEELLNSILAAVVSTISRQ
ncbi:MAG: type II toxin-antitoxin system PemK/MazF family toxin [Eubacterium sp.]|nr:type II toxin-antitoxin system PemK/MazF family toxin [Eubacterium sp.]